MPDVRSSRVRAKPLLALVALLLVAVVAERCHWFGRLRALPEPSLVWIWSADPPSLVRPAAFFLAQDMEIAAPPPSARLLVLGDPEYIVYLNGTRIGSGVYRPESPLDVYEVGSLLRSGENRVVLELRSPIGSGGATLRVEDGTGRTLLASDGSWRFYPKAWKGLLEGEPFWGRSTAKVLGSSPLGRWGSPPTGPAKPLFSDAVEVATPKRARTFRLPLSSRHWIALGQKGRASRGLGGLVEFDFGETVSGYLHLDFAPAATSPGLLRFANRPADRVGWSPDEVVLPDGNRSFWQDAMPRSFRYLEVAGLPSLRGAVVLPVREQDWLALSTRPPLRGLLGLVPPVVRYPVADQIWKDYLDLPLVPVPAPADVLKRGDRGRTKGQMRGLRALRRQVER